MRRTTLTPRLWSAGLAAVLSSVAGCAPADPAASKEEPQGVAAAVAARFEVQGSAEGTRRPALSPALVERVERDGAWLRPRFSEAAKKRVSRPAAVALPSLASGPFVLTDATSGMRVEVSLAGAREVKAEVDAGYVVYRGAHASGADLVHRATPEGTEDYLVFERAPAEPVITYSVDVSAVAGLRLAGNTLELLDAGGVPRLRVAPPYSVDAHGEAREATLAVDGCAVDRSPKAPWDRPPTPPGASKCEVRVRFDPATYPAIVDPYWAATGSMTTARVRATATLLPSGDVLVAGGVPSGTTPTNTAELYHPASGTFAATGSMASARTTHTATLLPTAGIVLVAGGIAVNGPSKAETYDPASGTFTTVGAMLQPRTAQTASLLDDDRVLMVGGFGVPSPTYVAASEIYDPTTKSFVTTGALAVGRYFHATTTLDDGRILVVGGTTSAGDSNTAEIYDRVAGTFSPVAGTMKFARSTHTATLLAGGRVLIAGQDSIVSELFDPTTMTFSTTGLTVESLQSQNATRLAGGTVLLTGGYVNGDTGSGAEIYDPGTGKFTSTSATLTHRIGSVAALLLSGKVLVAGGYDPDIDPLTSAELYDQLPAGPGVPCTVGGECLSGFCVDSVCCDVACDSPCTACSKARKGAGADGACGPVAAGTDPKNSCTDDGSPSCQQDGACDGSGACRKYASQAACSPTACTKGSDCTSGFCVDGVCCDSACGSPCHACTAAKKGGGLDGVCGAAAADTDPHDDCAIDASYPESCKADGLCDGTGACRVDAKAGTVCDATTCADGMVTAPACDGLGFCVKAAVSCAPYVACGSSSACATSCGSDQDCSTGAFCLTADHTCHGHFDLGAACTSDGECDSGHCVDEVCCNATCDKGCEACTSAKKGAGNDGECGPVAAGTDPRDGCATSDATSCGTDGACDGKGACRLHALGTACGQPACEGNAAETLACDGFGVCAKSSSKCEPFACEDGACKADCAAVEDCATGYTCEGGACKLVSPAACDGDHTVTSPSGHTTDCSPYRCAGAQCRKSCTTVDDCVSPSICSEDFHCEPPADIAIDRSCLCQAPGGAGGSSELPAAAALALLAVVARRRGKRS